MKICTICQNPRRVQIDREIVSGVSLPRVAEIYSLESPSALYRHAKNCISRQLVTAVSKVQTTEAFELLKKIDQIISRAEDIFTRNYLKEKDLTALKALNSQRNTIQLLCQVSASLHQAKQAEIDLLRLKNGETTEESKEQFANAIKILTSAELSVLLAIQEKITNKQRDRDCLAEYTASLTEFQPIISSLFIPPVPKLV
ncbi:MAG: hypothetical protein D4R64_18645 [Porphyromonadaceae bacterium]|nr:MAG: hypothetical protein D4R64_18645 [Porphyromonadaceae bacterium]